MGTRQPLVLVVDDQPDIRRLLEACLTDDGFRVRSAADAAQARRIAADEEVGLAIVDAVMPGEDGTALAASLAHNGVPVVMMSGDPEAMARLDHLPYPYLRKPFRLLKLTPLVSLLLLSAS